MNFKSLPIFLVLLWISTLSIFAVMCGGQDGGTDTITSLKMSENEEDLGSEGSLQLSVDYLAGSKNNKIFIGNPGSVTASNVHSIPDGVLSNIGVSTSLMTKDGSECKIIQTSDPCILYIDIPDTANQSEKGTLTISADNVSAPLTLDITINKVPMCAAQPGGTCSDSLPLKIVPVSLILNENKTLNIVNNTNTDITNLSITMDDIKSSCISDAHFEGEGCAANTLGAQKSCQLQITASENTCQDSRFHVQGINSLPLDFKLTVTTVPVRISINSVSLKSEDTEIIVINPGAIPTNIQMEYKDDGIPYHQELANKCVNITQNNCQDNTIANGNSCTIYVSQNTDPICEKALLIYNITTKDQVSQPVYLALKGSTLNATMVLNPYLGESELPITVTNNTEQQIQIGQPEIILLGSDSSKSGCISIKSDSSSVTPPICDGVLNMNQSCQIILEVSSDLECLGEINFNMKFKDSITDKISRDVITFAVSILSLPPSVNPVETLEWGKSYTLKIEKSAPNITLDNINFYATTSKNDSDTSTNAECHDCVVLDNQTALQECASDPNQDSCIANFTVKNIWAKSSSVPIITNGSPISFYGKVNGIKVTTQRRSAPEKSYGVSGLDIDQLFKWDPQNSMNLGYLVEGELPLNPIIPSANTEIPIEVLYISVWKNNPFNLELLGIFNSNGDPGACNHSSPDWPVNDWQTKWTDFSKLSWCSMISGTDRWFFRIKTGAQGGTDSSYVFFCRACTDFIKSMHVKQRKKE